MNRPPAAAPEGQVVDESTRTLRMAQQTADAAIAEAKADAEKIVAEAKAKADEIVLLGRQAADRELREQREQVAAERRAWESRRQELVATFTELELRLSSLRDLYEEAHRSVRAALDEPALTTPVAGAEAPSTSEPVDREPPAAEESDHKRSEESEPEPAPATPPPTFGVVPPPPEPPPGVLGGPAAPEPAPATVGAEQTSPFYAWTPGQSPQGSEPPPSPPPAVSPPDNPAGPAAESAPPPAPPQRRGLFGH
jgi:vacuolar-type H+-ATPase subunit H